MQIEIQHESLGVLIDALDTAIEVMTEAERFTYIEDLKILKLSLTILHHKGSNSAAKEQREGRANAECTCCDGNESNWFAKNSCQLHKN